MSIWITLVNLLKRLVSTFTRCLVMETLRVRWRLIFGRKKFVLGQSLYNPQALGDLGTQIYLLNKWYMQASTGGDFCVGVRIRDEHWFRGDDVMYVDFAEFHQLCHLTSLDKVIISCYCL